VIPYLQANHTGGYMWTQAARKQHAPRKGRYPSDLTDAEWILIEPLIPPAQRGGGPRETDTHTSKLRCAVSRRSRFHLWYARMATASQPGKASPMMSLDLVSTLRRCSMGSLHTISSHLTSAPIHRAAVSQPSCASWQSFTQSALRLSRGLTRLIHLAA